MSARRFKDVLMVAAFGHAKMSRGRRIRRFALFGFGLLLGVLVMGELTLRFGVGLGDPPLYVMEPEIEYMLKPGTYRRYGHLVKVNSAHMRGTSEGALTERGGKGSGQRVLVLGDSITAGSGSHRDEELAVGLASDATLTMLNASAPSWGPGNRLAYVKRFGTFGCDTAVIVLNAYDYGDVRLHQRLPPELPTTSPSCAIAEVLRTSGRRNAPLIFGKADWGVLPFDEAAPTEPHAGQSIAELRALITLLRAQGVKVAAVYHPFEDEMRGKRNYVGGAALLGELTLQGVPVVPMAHWLGGAEMKGGLNGPALYSDGLHLTVAGQRVLADALRDAARMAQDGAGGGSGQ